MEEMVTGLRKVRELIADVTAAVPWRRGAALVIVDTAAAAAAPRRYQHIVNYTGGAESPLFATRTSLQSLVSALSNNNPLSIVSFSLMNYCYQQLYCTVLMEPMKTATLTRLNHFDK